jgi:hypothetical protein
MGSETDATVPDPDVNPPGIGRPAQLDLPTPGRVPDGVVQTKQGFLDGTGGSLSADLFGSVPTSLAMPARASSPRHGAGRSAGGHRRGAVVATSAHQQPETDEDGPRQGQHGEPEGEGRPEAPPPPTAAQPAEPELEGDLTLRSRETSIRHIAFI